MVGGMMQRRGGTARHDAVAWGYARAADCARAWTSSRTAKCSGFEMGSDGVTGVHTSRGTIRCTEDRAHCRRALHDACGQRQAFACRSSLTPCRRWCPSRQARSGHRGARDGHRHVREPVGQGRARIRQWAGPVSLLRAARQLSDHARHHRRAGHALSCLLTSAADAPVGGHRRCRARFEPDHRARAGAGPVPRTADGEPADSRRFPAGGYLPGTSHGHGRAPPCRRPFGYERFATGALIDEAGAAGIAH